jgi:RHS repeat-associated protein
MLNGAFDRTDFQYDAFGYVRGESPPCTFVGCAASIANQSTWTIYLRDDLNRLINVARPVSATNNSIQETSIGYYGLQVSVTDANQNTVTRDYHVTGQLGRSTDASTARYAQTFYYDSFGSLLSVTDNASPTVNGSNALFTATYDYGLRAFQTNATDDDLDVSTQAGQHRSYNYDALGELTSWSDAKGQTFSAAYDLLSRPLVRTEPDLTTTWNWGNSAANFNIGKLASVTASNTSIGTYAESYTYDSKSRLQQRNITIPGDASYAYTTTYDPTTGLQDTLTYPVSTSGYQLKLKYGYANGVLNTISDFNSPSTVFWTANTVNPSGQITQESLGNGVIVNRSFDAITGWLASIQAGVGGGAALQNASFLYDFVGNVTQRQDSNLGLTENFFYDADNRLDHSTLGSVTNLQMKYDPFGNGNIASRSDVGAGTNWTYDPQKRHAVIQAGTGGYSYTYDNNGNATSRNGFPITWTSYNYPSTVAAAGESAQFWYGPDRQRFETLYTGSTGTETTYQVGQFLQKVVNGGTTDYRHTIYAGNEPVAIYSRTSTGVNSLRYLLTDHQGSFASIVSNSTPGPVANYVTESFTAFGNRRSGSSWSGAPTGGDETLINGISREGYTGHTALGVSMGLNHMNGRIQDAVTGRFLSADPTIPDASNTQSFNRYSYVNNNPLSSIDPTGFDDEGGGEVTVTGYPSGGWFDSGWAGPAFACPCGPRGSLHVPAQGLPRAQSTDLRLKPAADTAATAASTPQGGQAQESPQQGDQNLPQVVVTGTRLPNPPPALFLGYPATFFAPAGTQFQALRQAGRNFSKNGGKIWQVGQFIGHSGTFNFQQISSDQGLGYGFYQEAANFGVGVFMEGFFDGSNLGYAEMTAAGQAFGAYGSSNWSPAQAKQWQQLWTAGWNAAQSGNYPVQVGTPWRMSFPLP